MEREGLAGEELEAVKAGARKSPSEGDRTATTFPPILPPLPSCLHPQKTPLLPVQKNL